MKTISNFVLAVIFAAPFMVNAADSGSSKQISKEEFQAILSACNEKADGDACSVNDSEGKCASQIHPVTKAKEVICKKISDL